MGAVLKLLLFIEALVQSRFVTSVIPCHFSIDLMHQATDIHALMCICVIYCVSV